MTVPFHLYTLDVELGTCVFNFVYSILINWLPLTVFPESIRGCSVWIISNLQNCSVLSKSPTTLKAGGNFLVHLKFSYPIFKGSLQRQLVNLLCWRKGIEIVSCEVCGNKDFPWQVKIDLKIPISNKSCADPVKESLPLESLGQSV